METIEKNKQMSLTGEEVFIMEGILKELSDHWCNSHFYLKTLNRFKAIAKIHGEDFDETELDDITELFSTLQFYRENMSANTRKRTTDFPSVGFSAKNG